LIRQERAAFELATAGRLRSDRQERQRTAEVKLVTDNHAAEAGCSPQTAHARQKSAGADCDARYHRRCRSWNLRLKSNGCSPHLACPDGEPLAPETLDLVEPIAPQILFSMIYDSEAVTACRSVASPYTGIAQVTNILLREIAAEHLTAGSSTAAALARIFVMV